ncbi:chromatin complexes subunit BAP18-like [Watersipora subatra]|uniref:chromatin complexes subunit BAP18-like n=1 Tax=Watersipora subatra TaxID=2589382 RepID=UPI00355B1D42
MMASSKTVAEIFMAAGKAFDNLGTMTLQLHPNPDVPSNNKWTVAEVESLHAAVTQFNSDLNKIAENMKSRTVSQVKQKMKDELLSSTGDDAEEPANKKLKMAALQHSTPSTVKKDKLTADDTTSDVESVTVYSELQVDEESSEDDASEVDV